MDWINKISEFIRNALEGKNKKKLIENALIVLIIGVIIVIAGSTFFGGKKDDGNQPPANAGSGNAEAVAKNLGADEGSEIEREIERVLSQIDGAGKVTVMITYYSGEEIVPAQDTKKTTNSTQERDNGGGTRNISQDEYESSIVFEDGQGGTKKPIILKKKMPEVKGVVVVAEGAGSTTVSESLVRAVQVLTDVPIHKIQVFKKESK